jgi:hypothetical protein
MTVAKFRAMLGWCSVINIALLLWWGLWFFFAHDLMYRFHGEWFKIPVETFDAIHYGGMAAFKIAIIMFNVVPYLALRIVGKRGSEK